ncbi:hypothetical protein [Planococcus maritimus]|uniref:hypothetical protein n=1 Tax=Planococcus maritimus TaxID=192421 RepID=UPI000795BCCB|nr:hypothetical protein [Planococcus maritimus]KYG70955.1 hypothetical protein AY633_15500 [Planococcus maritimus]
MIKNKAGFIVSFIVFAICMTLFFPFPNGVLNNANFIFMSFPIQDYNGYNFLGVFGSILFIVAIILLFNSLEKYRFRTVFAVVIVYMVLPSLLIIAYQETLATGVSAISYDGNGHCSFEAITENEVMGGECDLVLHNRSNEAVTIELEFMDSVFREDDMRMASLMNLAGPHLMTIDANSQQSIHLEELLDISDVSNHIYSGEAFGIHIKVVDGEKSRIL